MASDGKIIIDTGLDLSGLEKDYKKIKNKLYNLGKDMPDTLKKQEEQLNDLMDKYKKLSGLNISNKSLQASQKELAKMQKELSKIEKAFQRHLNIKYEGLGVDLTPEFSRVLKQLVEVDEDTKEFYDTWVKSTHEVSRLKTEIAQLDAILKDIGDSSLENIFGDAENKIKAISIEMEKLPVKKYGNELGSVEEAINKIANNLKNIKSSKDIAELERRLQNISSVIKNEIDVNKISKAFSEISVKAKPALTSIKSVSDEAKKMSDNLRESTAAIKDIAITPKPKQLTVELQKIYQWFRNVGDIIKKIGGSSSSTYQKLIDDTKRVKEETSGLTKTLKRLYTRVKYALLAGFILKGLRNAFSSFVDYMKPIMMANASFVQSLSIIKANLITAFNPILEHMIPALVDLAKWLSIATRYLVEFMSLLSGKSIADMQKSAQKYQKIVDASKDLGKATKNANKEAKKFLATFDEINKLAEDSKDVAGSMAGLTQIPFQYELYDENKVENFAKRLKNKLKRIAKDFWNNLIDEINTGILASIAIILGDMIWKHFKKLRDSDKGGTPPAPPSPAPAVDAIKWNEKLKELYRQSPIFIPEVTFDYKKFLERVKAGFATAPAYSVSVSFDISKFKKSLEDALKITPKTMPEIEVKPLPAIDYKSYYLKSLNEALKNTPILMPQIKTLPIPAINWRLNYLKSLNEAIKNTPAFMPQIKTLPIPRINYEEYSKSMEEIKTNTLAFIKTSKENLSKYWTWVNSAALTGAFGFSNVIYSMWKGIDSNFNTAIKNISSNFQSFMQWTLTEGVSWGNSFLSIVAGIGTGIMKNFSTTFNRVAEGFKSLMKYIGEKISGIWNEYKVPILLTSIGIAAGTIIALTGGLSAPLVAPTATALGTAALAIPALATGTVVPPNKEFMAILGDNTQEHEVVSPVSTIEDAVRNVLAESGFNKQSTVVLQVDGRELGRVTLPYINEEKSRIGTILSNRAVMA